MYQQELIDSLEREIYAIGELHQQLGDRSAEVCEIAEKIFTELSPRDGRGIWLFEQTRDDAYRLFQDLGEMRGYLEQLRREFYLTETPPQPPENMES